MLTVPTDLPTLWQWTAEDAQTNRKETRERAGHVWARAQAVRATAAQLCTHAALLRAVGQRRRQILALLVPPGQG